MSSYSSTINFAPLSNRTCSKPRRYACLRTRFPRSDSLPAIPSAGCYSSWAVVGSVPSALLLPSPPSAPGSPVQSTCTFSSSLSHHSHCYRSLSETFPGSTFLSYNMPEAVPNRFLLPPAARFSHKQAEPLPFPVPHFPRRLFFSHIPQPKYVFLLFSSFFTPLYVNCVI